VVRIPVTLEPSSAPVGGSSFRGIWEESTRADLGAMQAQVDQGHEPWRTDAKLTAQVFVQNVFHWSASSVDLQEVPSTGGARVFHVWNTDVLHEAGAVPGDTNFVT